MRSKSFEDAATRWSAFERELFGLMEGCAASEPLTKGFAVLVYMDHRSNLFTGSLLGNKRVNKSS